MRGTGAGGYRPDGPVRVSRRSALKGAAALAVAAGSLGVVAPAARVPRRPAGPADPGAAGLPDIQFDVAAYSAPEQLSPTGGPYLMPPVHTFYVTARLLRTPTRADQRELRRVLETLEASYPFGAAGLMTFVAYGLPYFARLPAGLVTGAMPRLRDDPTRWVLEEAVPGPTDVHPDNPGVSKRRFTVPVRIEHNDLLITLRSDQATILQDVVDWLRGSGTLAGRPIASPDFAGLLELTSSRHQFVQTGLPRRIAEQGQLPFARFIQPDSPMWMGFSDQQVNASGPPPICTFAGTESARLTSAVPGDYFDNGAIQHLSHVILDLLQFFDMADADTPPSENANFTQRVQYMFHAPAIHPGNADQLADGGGPSFLPAENRGRGTPSVRPAAPGCRPGYGGWATCPHCSGHRAPPTVRRCTCASTVPGSTRWTYRTGPGSRSCSSACSCRPRTGSPPCGTARLRWIWRPATGCRSRTTGWNGS